MDSILVVGNQDERVGRLLSKLGYTVIGTNGEGNLADLITSEVIDLIIVDSRLDSDCIDLTEFLRSDETTKTLPLIFLAENRELASAVSAKSYDKLELVQSPFSVGALASKVATQLRLRKMAGKDELKATLSEMNATLRDLNEHFRKEMEDAKQIQESLLPEKLPNDERVELAVYYEPLEEVGGDWYFIKTNEEGLISAQVADVTGHGLAAAFIGAMTKLAMTAAGVYRPDQQLRRMNELMAPQMPPGRFVTMCSYLYCPDTGTLEFARAGHPPGLLFHQQTGEVEQLMGDGFAVGFFDDSEYSLISTQLQPGDVFVIYTDGIPEAQDRNSENYGMERLARVLKSSKPGDSAADIAAAVLNDFEDFVDGRLLKDDVTLLVLKRKTQ